MMLFLGGLTTSFAQDARPSKEERKEEKKEQLQAHLTQKLNLSEKEQDKVWSIMESMSAELKENRKEFKKVRPSKDKKIDDMTDAEVEAMMDGGFEMKKKDIEIRQKYHEQLIDAIGVKRTAKFYHAEKNFKKNQKKGPKGQGTPPGGPRGK